MFVVVLFFILFYYFFFFCDSEKERFAQCDELVEDRSLSTKLLSPFWEFLVRLIPLSIAPNLISLAGLLCTIQAFYLCFSYMATHPRLVTVGSAALIFAYQTLDALDGLQARRTSNTSPVGALFDHACDNVAVVFVSLVKTQQKKKKKKKKKKKMFFNCLSRFFFL